MRSDITSKCDQIRLVSPGCSLYQIIHHRSNLNMILVKAVFRRLCTLDQVNCGLLLRSTWRFSRGDLVKQAERRKNEFLLFCKVSLDENERLLRNGRGRAAFCRLLCEALDNRRVFKAN